MSTLSTKTKCKPGQRKSRSSGRCRVPPCKNGMILNRKSGNCRKKCIPGSQYRSRSGRCKNRSPKRKSPKRKSPKRKSPKRKSPKRKSPKRKSPKRKSPSTKSRSRKPPCKKPGQTRSRSSKRCRVPPCKDGMIRNKKSGNCRKKCISGSQYRSRSGRCKNKSPKRTSPKRTSPKRTSPKRKSPKRKSPSTKSRSRKPPCKKPGQTRSRSSKRCRVPPCKDGMIRNKKTGNCRKKCIPGVEYRSRSGRCKPIMSTSGSGSTSGSSSINQLDASIARLGQHFNTHSDPFQNWANTGVLPPGRHGTPSPQAGRKMFGKSSTSSQTSTPFRFGIKSSTSTASSTPSSTASSTSTSTPTSTASSTETPILKSTSSSTSTPDFIRSEHWCVKKPKLPKFNFFKKSTESKSTQAGTQVGTHVDASTQAGHTMKRPKRKSILPPPDRSAPTVNKEAEKALQKHFEYMKKHDISGPRE